MNQNEQSGQPNPPTVPAAPQVVVGEADATHGIIPYKNPMALAAYYVAILGFWCPGVGIIALIFGIKGLRARKATPIIRGSVHAWFGIIVGGLATLAWLGCGSAIAVGAWSSARSNAATQTTPTPAADASMDDELEPPAEP